MLFLHGILGNRANWRGIARRFVAARPDWGAVLVDLREHGDSLGLQAPHDLQAVTDDLAELERSLALTIGGAIGHSFGGKVVLEWLRSSANQITEAWVIDASPSPSISNGDSNATAEVLRALESLPRTWPSREAFVAALIDAGQPKGIAQWLAMNLRRTDDGARRFGPELSVIRELIEDYARTDCWDIVETPPPGCSLGLVIGAESTAFSPADRERAERIAKRNPQVAVHLVEGAGHWVHVDAPDALLALLNWRQTPAR
ncbi:MAG: alpha/beta fold hydrolase [Myxococcales bacterium]|nr:alpha/beta fold hydrolase [Myxococcales bacterium]